MKNVSALKPSSKTDSPKTPGGISKSLLTPCRRIGLSRNFRKSGASPFQSPLSNTQLTQVNVETRKRKESLEETPQTPEINVCKTTDVVSTPTRNVELPRRKKSKTLLATLNKANDEPETDTQTEVTEQNILKLNEELTVNESSRKDGDESKMQSENKESVATPVRLKSKSKSKKIISPSKHIGKVIHSEKENACTDSTVETADNTKEDSENLIKEKSPNNLTKECMVVIQKKLFKKELKETLKPPKTKEKTFSTLPKETSPQTLFDSDSDDVPLVQLNKEIIKKPLSKIDEDDDFVLNKSLISKSDTKPSKTKSPPTIKNKKNPRVLKVDVHKPSQSSGDDDDDFMEKKRTIIVRKSYDKVLKPQKAKSTGSITQKDIDDLKARIETKKKMLLAKAMTEDTKELRDLIKKWQKGCQEALMELMDLMKNKLPDKQNMDYSEILKTLKIPASMVGYDSDQECFLTPDDESIILAKV